MLESELLEGEAWVQVSVLWAEMAAHAHLRGQGEAPHTRWVSVCFAAYKRPPPALSLLGLPQPLYNLSSGMPHTEAWRGADLSRDPAEDLVAAE